MREFIFTWSIENISYAWHNTGEKIFSPVFFAGPMQDTSWTLSLYPRGIRDSDYISLYLHRQEDRGPINVAFNFEFSCLSADTSALCTCFILENFMTFTRGANSGFGESQFIKRHELFGRKKDLCLPQGILTLRCRFWKDADDTNEFNQISARTRLTIERIVSNEAFDPDALEEITFHIHSELQNKALMSVSIVNYGDSIDLATNPIAGGKVKSSTFKLTCVDRKTKRQLFEHSSCFFKMLNPEVWRLPFSYKVLHRVKDHADKSDDFQIITEFVYSTGEENEVIERNCPQRIPEFLSHYVVSCFPSGEEIDSPSICKELWNLYQEKLLCDVELKTENKSFFAHKFVLCARSPVFLAMLTGEMKEKINKCIEIEDISAESLEKILIFLYTDAFEDIEWDTVSELYYAADKYQIERLKLLCSSYLVKNLVCDSVCELLILADRHNDSVLKRKVDNFIWRNEDQVFRSTKWKKHALEQPEMAMKTMLSKYEEKDNQSPAKTFDDIISSCPTVVDDFESLYRSQIISDIVIKTKSATFSAHKTFLLASSPIFKDMSTETSLRDKSSDFFLIEDLEDDTVSRLLLFIYTDSIENAQWDNVVKLYHAANMFQIQRLKFGCSCFLLKNLKITNVGNLLLLAHEKNDVKLEAAVKEYIFLYAEEIFGSDEWAHFGKSNFHLAFETMLANYKRV